MTQNQLLISLISIIPLLNCALIKFCVNFPRFVNLISKFLPVLFFTILVGICGNISQDNSYLALIQSNQAVVLGFDVDELALAFLFLLNFLWLIFVFYSQKFLSFSPDFLKTKNTDNLQCFFMAIISFVGLIIVSKNLLSILFFYNCLIVLSHFFALKFLHKRQTKFSYFFTFLLYLESIFLFLAIVATYKFVGQIDFAQGGIISDKLTNAQYSLLLACYLAGLFFSIFFASHLLYRNINIEPIIIYALFFLSYAFSTLYIFLKLLEFVFGFEQFSSLILTISDGIIFNIIQFIFLINIAAVSVFLVFSGGLKASFFYLFFQQFLFALFTVFIFAIFEPSKIYPTLFSFSLSITLLFLVISNFVLYLKKSEQKWLGGAFYNLKITSILFIFAVANLIGIAPALGLIEKLALLKIISQKNLVVAGIIFGINFLSLIVFSWKNFYPIFLLPKETKSENQKSSKEIAKDIDSDSSLILTPLVVAVSLLLGLILFPILTKFL
jgi:formate hydrogenlyase subunit 3/multisubunit Na+/H+ antiporter MnhD subunit